MNAPMQGANPRQHDIKRREKKQMARAIDQFLAAIRQAIYGRDVREAIASGIEQCYDDSTASAQKADIEAKGAEVLASIPDTYDDLQNDVDNLKSAIVLNATSLGQNSNIDAWGGIISVANPWMVYVAPITKGIKYKVVHHESQLICAFYNTENAPTVGDSAFDEKRIVDSTTNEITAPIDGWIAFRSATTKTDESIILLTSVSAIAERIPRSIDEEGGLSATLALEQFGSYTGRKYIIDSPIELTYYGDRIKTLTDCYFVLNSDMFTWIANNSSWPLPIFENCVFYGNGNSIVVDGKYISQARFINCVFYNCSLITSGNYVQTGNFIGCRFIGTVDFINATGCGDITFESCQGESDFKASLVNLSGQGLNVSADVLRLKNCVFEGNTSKIPIIFANGGYIYIENSYLEGNTNGIINATGTTLENPELIISITGSKIYECGDYAIILNSSYSGKPKVIVTVDGCILSASTSKYLINNNNVAVYVSNNCIGTNVTFTKSQYITSQSYTFVLGENSVYSVTVQLQPGSTYFITQYSAYYSGMVVYGVVTSGSGGTMTFDKIHDDENKWTLTAGADYTLTIASTTFGGCSVIKVN